jgi:hypothetical protein
MAFSWIAVVLGFTAPGHASIRYWLFVAAHGLNCGGFVLAAWGDAAEKRPFSATRLVYLVFTEFAFAVLGPIAMGAAAATMR